MCVIVRFEHRVAGFGPNAAQCDDPHSENRRTGFNTPLHARAFESLAKYDLAGRFCDAATYRNAKSTTLCHLSTKGRNLCRLDRASFPQNISLVDGIKLGDGA